ncbi:hypothetical protein D9M69_674240 [compost metagenome]
MLVLGLLDAVELQPRAGRVLLQVKRRDLDRLLFVGGQAREAVGEGVGDAELHIYCDSICSIQCFKSRATTPLKDARLIFSSENAFDGALFFNWPNRNFPLAPFSGRCWKSIHTDSLVGLPPDL